LREYYGWVPTITGRLSFSTIGTGKNPEKEFKFFKALGPSRCTVVAQKRRTTDAVLGRFGDFLNRRRKREGHSVFVFFGETNKNTEFSILSGPCVELDEVKFEELKPHLEELGKLRNKEEVRSKFEDCAKQFLEAAAVRPGAYSAIEIQRDGKAKISFVPDDRVNQQVAGILASQVFFFLRDITHIHQHHAPATDTILDVTPVSAGEDGWKRETLYSLYRWVIHRKRDKSLVSLINCTGVLAYAEAFEKTHCKELTNSEVERYRSGRAKTAPSFVAMPRYNHDTTLASVQAGVESLREHEKNRFDLFDVVSKFLAIFAALVTLITPLYSAGSGHALSGQQKLVANVALWMNGNIVTVVGGSLVLAAVLALTTVVKRRFFHSELMHDWMRVFLSVFRSRIMIAVLLIVLLLSVVALTLGVGKIAFSSATSDWLGPGRI